MGTKFGTDYQRQAVLLCLKLKEGKREKEHLNLPCDDNLHKEATRLIIQQV